MITKMIIVNLFTLIRIIGTILLIPVYRKFGGLTVGVMSLLCYASDSIDGILARKWKVSTFFGAIFDSIADKLLTIMTFIILYLITPYAIIPIISECLIVLLQLFKFSRNLNIKSNIIGKIKTFVLAISVVLTFFASSVHNISFISESFKNYLVSIDNLYFYLLLPSIVMEIITLLSYFAEVIIPKNRKIFVKKPKKIEKKNLSKNEYKEYLKKIWFSPEFYNKHKDDTNLRDLRKLSR